MANELSAALLGGLQGAGPNQLAMAIGNPELATQLPQLTLSQAMQQQGLSGSPATPAQALGRLGQALAGTFLQHQAIDAIQKSSAGAAPELASIMQGDTKTVIPRLLTSNSPYLRQVGVEMAQKSIPLYQAQQAEAQTSYPKEAGKQRAEVEAAGPKSGAEAAAKAPFTHAGTITVNTPNGPTEIPITAETLKQLQGQVPGTAPAQTPGAAIPSTPVKTERIAPDITSIGQKENAKEFATEGAKAQMAPIAEIMKESRTAPQAINALNLIEDTAKKYGDNIVTGPYAEQALKVKQALANLGIPLGKDVQASEIIKKMNAQLASASLPAFTNRGTQFDLKVFMENNPGLSNSIKGTLFLTDISKQIHRQNLELASLAQDPNNRNNWNKVQSEFYASHPIVNPLTGNPLGVAADTKEQKAAVGTKGAFAPPAGAPTAVGPNGHKIVVVNGAWVDAATGEPLKK